MGRIDAVNVPIMRAAKRGIMRADVEKEGEGRVKMIKVRERRLSYMSCSASRPEKPREMGEIWQSKGVIGQGRAR